MADRELQQHTGRTSTVRVDRHLPFSKQGNEAATSLVDLSVISNRSGQERYVGRFIRKRLKDNWRGRVPEAAPDQQLEKYSRLKRLGLPVLPTFRTDQEMKSIYLTYYDSSYRIFDNYQSMTEEDRAGIVNLSEIEQQIQDIAVRAYDQGNGVYLPLDSYTILVDEHGSAQVMLMDLGYGSFLLDNGSNQRGVEYSLREVQNEASDFIAEVIYNRKEPVWFG